VEVGDILGLEVEEVDEVGRDGFAVLGRGFIEGKSVYCLGREK